MKSSVHVVVRAISAKRAVISYAVLKNIDEMVQLEITRLCNWSLTIDNDSIFVHLASQFII